MYFKSVLLRSKIALGLYNNLFLNGNNKIAQTVRQERNLSSGLKSINLSGIFPPITTPFNTDESIAYDKLQLNFQKWNKIPLKGYLVEGSNGEYVYLSSEEKIELVKKAKQFKAPDKILLGGSGCESTKETIEMTAKMAEAGIDAAMVVTPCFYKSGMKDQALHRHFEEVANRSPVPVILYNVPANTGVELNVDVIVGLAQHENIIGLKESGGDITKIGNVLHQTRNLDFQVLAGSAGFLLTSLQLGCVGGVCALANVLGKEVCDLYQLFTKGSQAQEEAVLLQKKLISPNAAVTKIFGVPGLKEVMDAKGFFGGPTRSPLQKLQPEESKKLKSIFTVAGFL